MVPEDCHPALVTMAAALRQRHPRFRIVARESSRLMSLLKPFIAPGFTVTFWRTIYMPASVRHDGAEAMRILRHEAVHLDQFSRHPVWMPLSYLLVAPAFVTMRARWELEAYAETMRCELEETGAIPDATLDHIERLFTGPAYLFMDVRRRRVRSRLEALRRELLDARPSPD